MARMDEKLDVNIEAEEDTLACILSNPGAIRQVADRLTPEHFYRDSHQHIYRACLNLYQQGRSCHVENVADELEQKGILDKIYNTHARGYQFLLWLSNTHAALRDDASDFAHKVIREATYRRLKFASHQIMTLAHHRDDAAVEQALQIVSDIAIGAKSHEASTFSDAIDSYLADYRQRKIDRQENRARGIPTGFLELDHLIGGLQPGCLYALGALTGAGKSAFALNVSLHIALSVRHVMFFSLEMSINDIVGRALSTHAELDHMLLRDAALDGEGERRMRASAHALKECDIKLSDHSYSINEVCLQAKQTHTRKKLDLIVVDYLQLLETIESKGRSTTRAEEVADFSRRLKRLAQELQVPVLALVQLNRNVEHRQEAAPKLADINESGRIAHDSDVVLFIYSTKEELEKRSLAMNYEVFIKVAKNRGGRMGDVALTFAPRFTKFIDPSQRREGDENFS